MSRSEKYSFDPNIRKNLADYPIDDSNSPISIANFNGYGGSTILYSAHFPRFHPSDFRVKTLDNIADDWPLSYSDLNPYFDENEKKMGVAGLVGDTAYPEYSSLLPPVPLGDMGKKLAKAFNEMNWHWWPSYAAINTDKRNNRAKELEEEENHTQGRQYLQPNQQLPSFFHSHQSKDSTRSNLMANHQQYCLKFSLENQMGETWENVLNKV